VLIKYLCFSYSLDSKNNLVSVLCCLVTVSIIKLVRKISFSFSMVMVSSGVLRFPVRQIINTDILTMVFMTNNTGINTGVCVCSSTMNCRTGSFERETDFVWNQK